MKETPATVGTQKNQDVYVIVYMFLTLCSSSAVVNAFLLFLQVSNSTKQLTSALEDKPVLLYLSDTRLLLSYQSRNQHNTVHHIFCITH